MSSKPAPTPAHPTATAPTGSAPAPMYATPDAPVGPVAEPAAPHPSTGLAGTVAVDEDVK